MHDMVSVVPDGGRKIVEIVEHSGWNKESWFTSTRVIESVRLPSFLDGVAKTGGHYQVDRFFPRIKVSFRPELASKYGPHVTRRSPSQSGSKPGTRLGPKTE